MASTRRIGNAQAIAEVKTVAISGFDAATTYRLTIGNKVVSVVGITSTAATASALSAAWNASEIPETQDITASVNSSTVTLTHDEEGVPFTVTSSVSGGSGTIGAVSTTTSASGPHFWGGAANWSGGADPTSGVCEVQTLTITGTPTGGDFTITYAGQTTAAIAHNANAAAVQAALVALSNIAVGDVVCTGGALPGTPVVITFGGLLGYQNVALATTTDSLTGGTAPASAITTTTPGSVGDDVYIDNSDIDIKYGLDQSAVVLNSLTVAGSYTGSIGLPEVNADGTDDYVEYREQYLKLGVFPGNAVIGSGEGDGSDRIKLNTGGIVTYLTVYQTGRGGDGDLEALLWKGTNANNTLTVYRGEVGVARFGGESATLATLKLGYVEDEAGDATVVCGSGLSVTTVQITGGELDLSSAATTVTLMGGALKFRTGAVTTLTNDGGAVTYSSSGAITTLNVGTGGSIQFDPTPRTVTNANLYAGGSILDPQKSVTWSNGISLIHCSESDVVLSTGKHVKITPVTL